MLLRLSQLPLQKSNPWFRTGVVKMEVMRLHTALRLKCPLGVLACSSLDQGPLLHVGPTQLGQESGVPKTSARPRGSLGRLASPRKGVILLVVLYHSERMQIKISQDVQDGGQGKAGVGLQLSTPSGPHTRCSDSQQWCVTHVKGSQPGSCPEPGVQGF